MWEFPVIFPLNQPIDNSKLLVYQEVNPSKNHQDPPGFSVMLPHLLANTSSSAPEAHAMEKLYKKKVSMNTSINGGYNTLSEMAIIFHNSI